MHLPRPASGDTITHAYGSVTNSTSMLACQYSQPKRPGDLHLLTLKVVPESRVTWATSVPIIVFLGLSVLGLGPMYATDRRQAASSLNAPWAGHNNFPCAVQINNARYTTSSTFILFDSLVVS